VLAGRQAVFVGASPDPPDEGIELHVADGSPSSERDLVRVHAGRLERKGEAVRVTDVQETVLWTGTAISGQQGYSVWVDDPDEPCVIWFQIDGVSSGETDVESY